MALFHLKIRNMLFKSKNYQIITHLTKDEAIKILQENTTKKKFFTLGSFKSEFEGFIKDDYFEIEKSISGRNSFNPHIKGNFIKIDDNTTEINFSLKMNWFVSVFFIFFITFIIIFGISSPFLLEEWYLGIGGSLFFLIFIYFFYFIFSSITLNNILGSFKKLYHSNPQEQDL